MKAWMTAAAAAVVLLWGGLSAEAAQPGLRETAAQVSEEAPALVDGLDARYPVWEGGTALQRARVNAAVEAETVRFATKLEKMQEHGDVDGWVRWMAGRTDGGLVSLVLLESVYPHHAAHPSTSVVGMTFDEKGYRVSREEALRRAAGTDVEAAVSQQAAERGLALFPEAWRQQTDWPEQFYVGADGQLYFIFQQYEIAPYAAGWIAIDAGPWDGE